MIGTLFRRRIRVRRDAGDPAGSAMRSESIYTVVFWLSIAMAFGGNAWLAGLGRSTTFAIR
jgi:hypothetical protein